MIGDILFLMLNYRIPRYARKLLYAPNDETQQVNVLTEINNHIDTLEVSQSTQFVRGRHFSALLDTKLDAYEGSPNLKFSF